jgi:hypothetical protein
VALAGQTGGANRVVLDFLFLLSNAEECIKTKERRIFCNQKVMRGSVVVFKGAYEIASLSSRKTCICRQAPSLRGFFQVSAR